LKQIILGTAGHIDHGKTSLIKAVTGIDTDRLKEEKLRGITIELGFASLDLPGGQHLGIVDVPGHEKFVKNMVAGASGIDIVAMVIAADEGVMPQTKEHMEICTLLGIKHGVVVLTKVDMVDEDWLELVQDDIKGFVKGTFLEDAPVQPVSSTTGQGIDEFIKSLEEICETVPDRPYSDLFRLPVDRVFTMKGFGTVITGTVVSGEIGVGDSVMVYTPGITSKVRGVQVHNKSVDSAVAGMRTAVNFQGLDKSSVNRGDVLAISGSLKPSYMLDVHLNVLNSNKNPIKNRALVRFHSGTSEKMGTIVLIDRDEALAGEILEAQIRFNSPVVGVRDDSFVLRSYSPVRTIGGGRILNPIPKKHKRFNPDVIKGLKTLVQNNPDETISFHVEASGYEGACFSDLKIMANMSDKHLQNAISTLLNSKDLLQADRENRIYIHKNTIEKLKTKVVEHLESYHKKNPLKAGIPKEELKSKLPGKLGVKMFNMLLVRMEKDKKIVPEEDNVRLANHKVSLGGDQADIRKKILESYQNAGLTPPYFKELSKTLDIDPAAAKDLLWFLVDQGLVVKVKDDLYYHNTVLTDLEKRLVDFLQAEKEISTPQFKEMTGISRKYVIPLIEYFDSKNVTIRIGDIRQLRKG
jgi:selenocysteine-specific elongation factor